MLACVTAGGPINAPHKSNKTSVLALTRMLAIVCDAWVPASRFIY